MSDWQPIATAPKDDGTSVLIVYAVQDGVRVTVAKYVRYDGYHGPQEGWYCDVGFVPPTHWMPLPAPPEPES